MGRRALPSLIAVLEHDAPFDSEIARATLETLMQLCETVEKVRASLYAQRPRANSGQPTKDDLGLFFTDAFLEVSGSGYSQLLLNSRRCLNLCTLW